MAVETSTPQRGSGPWDWLDERIGLSAFAYDVPPGANTLPYMLGAISLVGFLVLLGTGIYLAQFYHPHPTGANESIAYLITRSSAGEFLRGLHFWMANLVAITVLLHLARVFSTASFRRPRELNWLVGLGLFTITAGFFFTGTVLKWDQEGAEALAHNEEIGSVLGSFGGWFTSDFTPSVPILTRLYFAHLSLLPALFTGLVLVHMALVKRHGISTATTTDGSRDAGPEETFAGHMRRAFGYGLLLTVGAGVLALVAAPAIEPLIDPGKELTKPPWLFLPFYPLENWFGVRALLWAPAVVFGLLALVPVLDRLHVFPRTRVRLYAYSGGVALFALMLSLGIFAAVSGVSEHIPGGG